MSKPTYEELQEIISKIYKTTRVESALGIEWANYPIEVFDELVELVTMAVRELDKE